MLAYIGAANHEFKSLFCYFLFSIKTARGATLLSEVEVRKLQAHPHSRAASCGSEREMSRADTWKGLLFKFP